MDLASKHTPSVSDLVKTDASNGVRRMGEPCAMSIPRKSIRFEFTRKRIIAIVYFSAHDILF